jgi:hypothetical protein
MEYPLVIAWRYEGRKLCELWNRIPETFDRGISWVQYKHFSRLRLNDISLLFFVHLFRIDKRTMVASNEIVEGSLGPHRRNSLGVWIPW